jgi:hypothetical protein
MSQVILKLAKACPKIKGLLQNGFRSFINGLFILLTGRAAAVLMGHGLQNQRLKMERLEKMNQWKGLFIFYAEYPILSAMDCRRE